MGDYDKAMKYIEIELAMDDTRKWAYFYYGLVNKILGNDDKVEEALLKSAELIKEGKDKEYVRTRVLEMKGDDKLGNVCYDRLIELLSDE